MDFVYALTDIPKQDKSFAATAPAATLAAVSLPEDQGLVAQLVRARP